MSRLIYKIIGNNSWAGWSWVNPNNCQFITISHPLEIESTRRRLSQGCKLRAQSIVLFVRRVFRVRQRQTMSGDIFFCQGGKQIGKQVRATIIYFIFKKLSLRNNSKSLRAHDVVVAHFWSRLRAGEQLKKTNQNGTSVPFHLDGHLIFVLARLYGK